MWSAPSSLFPIPPLHSQQSGHWSSPKQSRKALSPSWIWPCCSHYVDWLPLSLSSSKSCLFIFNFPCTLTQLLSSPNPLKWHSLFFFSPVQSSATFTSNQLWCGECKHGYLHHCLRHHLGQTMRTEWTWEMHSKWSLVLTFSFSHRWQVSQIIQDVMGPFKKSFILFYQVVLVRNPDSKPCLAVAAERMLGCTWPRMSPQDIPGASQIHPGAWKHRPKQSSWWAIHKGSYFCPHHARTQVRSFSPWGLMSGELAPRSSLPLSSGYTC